MPAAFVLSYDPYDTHADLTREAIKLYEATHGDVLSAEEEQWLVEGVINEDADLPSRVLNHAYDPVHNAAWTSPDWNLPTYTSKDWAHNEEAQTMFPGVYGGGPYTWERAVYDFQQDDKERAYVGLGHIFHLIQDATVPAHVRQDPHPPAFDQADPYEHWAGDYTKNHEMSIAESLIAVGETPITYPGIDKYFDEVAGYTSHYFFSKDSIADTPQIYPNPLIHRNGIEILSGGHRQWYGYGLDGNNLSYKLLAYNGGTLLDLEDYEPSIMDAVMDEHNVNSDYWDRLSKQAVLNGAGILELFHKSVGLAPQQKPLSFWENKWQFFGYVSEAATELAVGAYQTTANFVTETYQAAEQFTVETVEGIAEAVDVMADWTVEFASSSFDSAKTFLTDNAMRALFEDDSQSEHETVWSSHPLYQPLVPPSVSETDSSAQTIVAQQPEQHSLAEQNSNTEENTVTLAADFPEPASEDDTTFSDATSTASLQKFYLESSEPNGEPSSELQTSEPLPQENTAAENPDPAEDTAAENSESADFAQPKQPLIDYTGNCCAPSFTPAPPAPPPVDTTPPVAAFTPLAPLQPHETFEISWTGNDHEGEDPLASGIAQFFVEWRRNEEETWTPVSPEPFPQDIRSANFTGEGGATYFFRIRAVDLLENASAWPEDGSPEIASTVIRRTTDFLIVENSGGTPSVAFNGAIFLVAWEENGEIRAVRVDQFGNALDQEPLVLATPQTDEWPWSDPGLAVYNSRRNPVVATDGEDFFVAWEDGKRDALWYADFVNSYPRSCENNPRPVLDIFGGRVTAGGDVLDPEGVVLAAIPGVQYSPAIAYDGSRYIVVFEDTNRWWDSCGGGGKSQAPNIYGTRVIARDGELTVLDPGGFAVADPTWLWWQPWPRTSQTSPAIACADGRCLIAWQDKAQFSDPFMAQATILDVESLAFLPAEFNPNNNGGIPLTAFPSEGRPGIIALENGNGFLVAWTSREGDSPSIRAARLLADGSVIEPGEFVIIPTGESGVSNPWFVNDGAQPRLMWRSGETAKFAAIDPASFTLVGDVVDMPALSVGIACEGTDAGCLVVWQTGGITGRFVR